MTALLAAVALIFLTAALLHVLSGAHSARAGWIAAASVVASFGLIVSAAPEVCAEPAFWSLDWLPSIGLRFSFRADALSLLFAGLISGIGIIVFTYAAAYLDASEHRRRFFAYLLTFMGAMLGVVLSGDLVMMFVFWELTSITSFLLIGYWYEREASRDGALKALVITGSGGLVMLTGIVLLGMAGGTYDIAALVAARETLASHPLLPAAAALIIVGAITKSAQVPFHLWLPSAMEAPTPVSAFLHAATMVKAGLYLVARLGPLLQVVWFWEPLLTTLGLVTMAWCSLLAFRQRDLKGLLAFSTVSQLGLILTLLASHEAEVNAWGLFHLLNHGVFKGALFLLVGVIEHESHTRQIDEIAPLRKKMPVTYTLLALATLSMAGVPPFGGFVSKELFLEHVLSLGAMHPALPVVAVVGAVLTACYSALLIFEVAKGSKHPLESAEHAHDPGVSLLWGPGLLVGLSLALGFFPDLLAGRLVEDAAGMARQSHDVHVHLALWHGINTPLVVSTAAIVGGVVGYFAWRRNRVPKPPVLIADRVYFGFLSGLESSARAITSSYMSGLLWRYVLAVYAVLIAGWSLVWSRNLEPLAVTWNTRSFELSEVLVVGACGLAALATCMAKTRLAAILALGANGYLLALLFGLLAAPDLALTQVMVETVSVALFLAVFVFLPPYEESAERRFRPFHAVAAAVIGVSATGLLYAARGNRMGESIAEYFVEHSVDLAGGHNIVNVILVDFRGLDTLGEITVLVVAALSCYGIIKIKAEDDGS